MKYILFLLLPVSAFCQDSTVATAAVQDTVPAFAFMGKSGIGMHENGIGYIEWSDGTFEIEGDTIKVIKLLLKRLSEAHEREAKLYDDKYKLIEAIEKYIKDMESAHEIIGQIPVQITKAPLVLLDSSQVKKVVPTSAESKDWIYTLVIMVILAATFLIWAFNREPKKEIK